MRREHRECPLEGLVLGCASRLRLPGLAPQTDWEIERARLCRAIRRAKRGN